MSEEFTTHQFTIAIIGVGYVGLPLAMAFAPTNKVIAFDHNVEKIEMFCRGKDVTGEVGDEMLQQSSVIFTANEADLDEANLFVVTVQTPVTAEHLPDLTLLEEACQCVGRHLKAGGIVTFESTVYPGVTEEVCVPILEKISGLRCGKDFGVAYSPERINPGDKVHTLETVQKVVSASDDVTLKKIAAFYGSVIKAGIYCAESIRIAEAAKVIENCQRDINIAFMNELSLIFERMGISTEAVLRAAQTKWNFLPFRPGLVGGHCIGVDPYYLTYCAKQYGYESKIIASGREINDGMAHHVVQRLIVALHEKGIEFAKAKVAIFGVTFKENCPDVRNSKVMEMAQELCRCGINPLAVDPVADAEMIRREYGMSTVSEEELPLLDAAIVAVAHDEFRNRPEEVWLKKFDKQGGIFFDIKSLFNPKVFVNQGFIYWSL